MIIRHTVMKSLIGCVLASAFCCLTPPAAQGQVTAVLTADNHYGLFHGLPDGGELTFVGRNEMGSAGDPGDYNWLLPETYEFDVPDGHHLFVVAWDEDAAVPRMLIGAFTMPDGSTVLSDTQAWESICGSGPSPRHGDVPPNDELVNDISAGDFTAPLWSLPNGSDPWAIYAGGPIADIPAEAFFIWFDGDADSTCLDHYAIFRTVDPVPTTAAAPAFRRGDTDPSGIVDLSDAVATLDALFLGGKQPQCMDAADADDSGSLDLTDAVFTLQFLFLAGVEPPAPGPFKCGVDTTPRTPPFPPCVYGKCP